LSFGGLFPIALPNFSGDGGQKMSSTPVKLVFLDLDGTVVDPHHQISPATLQQLHRIRSQGVRVSVATGRPYFGARKATDTLEITETSVFFSGSLAMNPRSQEVFFSEELSTPDVLCLLEESRRFGLHIELYTKDHYFTEEHGPLSDEIHVTYLGVPPTVTDLEKLASKEKLLKAVCLVRSEDEPKLRLFLEKFKNLTIGVAYGAAHEDILFASITSPKASRENAFDRLLEHFQVQASEVAAFGDSESDIPFLQRAGYGFAMGNASESVRQAAKLVTQSVTEDGVANALKRLIP
jgi:Cof subfamily protein (haloacid dehalogenase superfamily)